MTLETILKEFYDPHTTNHKRHSLESQLVKMQMDIETLKEGLLYLKMDHGNQQMEFYFMNTIFYHSKQWKSIENALQNEILLTLQSKLHSISQIQNITIKSLCEILKQDTNMVNGYFENIYGLLQQQQILGVILLDASIEYLYKSPHAIQNQINQMIPVLLNQLMAILNNKLHDSAYSSPTNETFQPTGNEKPLINAALKASTTLQIHCQVSLVNQVQIIVQNLPNENAIQSILQMMTVNDSQVNSDVIQYVFQSCLSFPIETLQIMTQIIVKYYNKCHSEHISQYMQVIYSQIGNDLALINTLHQLLDMFHIHASQNNIENELQFVNATLQQLFQVDVDELTDYYNEIVDMIEILQQHGIILDLNAVILNPFWCQIWMHTSTNINHCADWLLNHLNISLLDAILTFNIRVPVECTDYWNKLLEFGLQWATESQNEKTLNKLELLLTGIKVNPEMKQYLDQIPQTRPSLVILTHQITFMNQLQPLKSNELQPVFKHAHQMPMNYRKYIIANYTQQMSEYIQYIMTNQCNSKELIHFMGILGSFYILQPIPQLNIILPRLQPNLSEDLHYFESYCQLCLDVLNRNTITLIIPLLHDKSVNVWKSNARLPLVFYQLITSLIKLNAQLIVEVIDVLLNEIDLLQIETTREILMILKQCQIRQLPIDRINKLLDRLISACSYSEYQLLIDEVVGVLFVVNQQCLILNVDMTSEYSFKMTLNERYLRTVQ
eukprot:NODE_310_length_10051_cov_0.839228.p2 type:complete len:725 gc:universal NODE_310_length_10051_cov_0.839228:843-3017(+)